MGKGKAKWTCLDCGRDCSSHQGLLSHQRAKHAPQTVGNAAVEGAERPVEGYSTVPLDADTSRAYTDVEIAAMRREVEYMELAAKRARLAGGPRAPKDLSEAAGLGPFTEANRGILQDRQYGITPPPSPDFGGVAALITAINGLKSGDSGAASVLGAWLKDPQAFLAGLGMLREWLGGKKDASWLTQLAGALNVTEGEAAQRVFGGRQAVNEINLPQLGPLTITDGATLSSVLGYLSAEREHTERMARLKLVRERGPAFLTQVVDALREATKAPPGGGQPLQQQPQAPAEIPEGTHPYYCASCQGQYFLPPDAENACPVCHQEGKKAIRSLCLACKTEVLAIPGLSSTCPTCGAEISAMEGP